MGKKGLEGVALERTATGTRLAVAFQAPLDDDPPDCTRIGLVDPATGTWSFASTRSTATVRAISQA